MTYFVCYLQEVNVEFEAYSISDKDHDGIKKLLQQVWSFTLYTQICSSKKIQAIQHKLGQISSFILEFLFLSSLPCRVGRIVSLFQGLFFSSCDCSSELSSIIDTSLFEYGC